MRHSFGLLIPLPAPLPADIENALSLERAGNWWNAGSLLYAVAQRYSANRDLHARLLTRAASCFELVSAFRDAGLAYEAAAVAARTIPGIDFQIVAELHLLAHFCSMQLSDIGTAANLLQQAAHAFEQVQKAVVRIPDRIPPLPIAAGQFTFAATCLRSAGNLYLEAGKYKDASFHFWLAAGSHLKQGHGYLAAEAMRQALGAYARVGEPLSLEDLRQALPLTQQQRSERLNIFTTMEDAAASGFSDQKQLNPQFPPTFVLDSVEQFMISAFEEFSRNLAVAGNHDDSVSLAVMASERQRRRYFRQRKWVRVLISTLAAISSNYGTDYKRWFASVIFVAAVYGWLYWQFRLIQPIRDFVDPFYFSIVTMTTVGYGDIQPVGSLGKLLACSEIVFGLAMFGVLVGIISRRVIKS